jgi:hypothetical protein
MKWSFHFNTSLKRFWPLSDNRPKRLNSGHHFETSPLSDCHYNISVLILRASHLRDIHHRPSCLQKLTDGDRSGYSSVQMEWSRLYAHVALLARQLLFVPHFRYGYRKEYEPSADHFRENSLPFHDLPDSQEPNSDEQPSVQDSSDDVSGDRLGPATQAEMKRIENPIRFIFSLRKMNKELRRTRKIVLDKRAK